MASIDRHEKALAQMRDLLVRGEKAELTALIERASAWRKLVT